MGIYEDYLAQYPEKSNSEIADLILDNEDLNIKRKSILRALQRTKNPAPRIVGEGRKGDSFTLSEEYEFRLDDIEIDIPRDQIAAAVAWYVDPSGLSVPQVCDKLWTYYKRDIDENFMTRIFKCLNVTKTSNGLAPHIVAEWDESQISEFFLKMRREKIEKKLSENEQFKSLYEDERKKTLNVERFLSSIKEHLDSGDQPDFSLPKKLNVSLDHDLVIVLSDWHVGQKSEVFNKDVYQERISNLCAQIKYYFQTTLRRVRNLYVLIVGDITDGPMANMRPEQALEQDLYHEQQCIYAARGIAQVVKTASVGVEGSIEVHGIGGNHGRVGPSRNDDPTRFADKMTYVLAEEMCKSSKKESKWNIHSKVVGSFMCRATQVIFLHGDRGAKNHKDLVWTHKDKKAEKFVVVSGHFHAVKAEEVDKDIYLFRGGSLPGTDDYGASLGYGNRAAQIMFEVYDDGPRMPIYLPVD